MKSGSCPRFSMLVTSGQLGAASFTSLPCACSWSLSDASGLLPSTAPGVLPCGRRLPGQRHSDPDGRSHELQRA
jgi:hypothetical protein